MEHCHTNRHRDLKEAYKDLEEKSQKSKENGVREPRLQCFRFTFFKVSLIIYTVLKFAFYLGYMLYLLETGSLALSTSDVLTILLFNECMKMFKP